MRSYIRRANFGRFDSIEATATPTNVEMKDDTFKITVKDENDTVIYSNEEEPFQHPHVPVFETALEYFGAKLSEDQKQFLSEALKGDTVGPALDKVLELINDDLRVTAKNNAYQRVFNAKKPQTEESLGNARASMVRQFMKTENVSDETAINALKSFIPSFKDYTLEDFRANKGKR